jgi:dihydropteroate synthase
MAGERPDRGAPGLTMTSSWRVRDRVVSLQRPVVLGILNVTPDSFSDGGDFFSTDAALRHAERLVAEGADGVDIGGESTRPGARPVTLDEELGRVLPVVRAARERFPDLLLSVDTVKSDVARAVLEEGADAINDVSGGRLDGRLASVCAELGAGIVLMHSRGTVAEMASYAHASYGEDVAADIAAELSMRIADARAAGVDAMRIVVDPGIGFAKRTEHSIAALAGLPTLVALGFPVMVGVSRKRVIGQITGVDEPRERVMGTVGANVAALGRGAMLFRVHDVRENRQALDAAWAVFRAAARRGGGQ